MKTFDKTQPNVLFDTFTIVNKKSKATDNTCFFDKLLPHILDLTEATRRGLDEIKILYLQIAKSPAWNAPPAIHRRLQESSLYRFCSSY